MAAAVAVPVAGSVTVAVIMAAVRITITITITIAIALSEVSAVVAARQIGKYVTTGLPIELRRRIAAEQDVNETGLARVGRSGSGRAQGKDTYDGSDCFHFSYSTSPRCHA